MTAYFSLCTLCCMRLLAILHTLLLTTCLIPGLVRAAPAIAEGASGQPLQQLMESEFLFQSGRFKSAFSYYRSLPESNWDAQQWLRAGQLADALGEQLWFNRQQPSAGAANDPDEAFQARRFAWALENERTADAVAAWQMLLRQGEPGLLASRAVLNQSQRSAQGSIQAALAAYALAEKLTPQEALELYRVSLSVQDSAVQSVLRNRVSGTGLEAQLAKLYEACTVSAALACGSAFSELHPEDMEQWQRRDVWLLSLQHATAAQQMRWLASLPQDASTYYQRIVQLSSSPDAEKSRALMAEMGKDRQLTEYQSASLQGSLAELMKDWPAASTNYQSALAAGLPSQIGIRLAVVYFRQGREDEALTQIVRVKNDVKLSEEIRRDAALTEIQFHEFRQSDKTDPAVIDNLYQAALNAWPNAQQLRYRLAMRLFQQGKVPAAMAELRHLLAVAPAYADALNAYGYTLAKELDKPRQAFEPIRQAYYLAPERSEILDSYGYVLHRLGRHREALPPLRKAWEKTPTAVTAGHLAQVFYALGDRVSALQYVELGLRLDAKEADLLLLQDRLR